MKVEDNQYTNQGNATSLQMEIIPGNIKEFFECEQYRLATSGFSTPIILILIGNQKLHQELLDCMLLLDSQQQIHNTEQGRISEETPNLPFKVFDLFSNFEDVYTNYMFGFNGGTELQNNGRQLLLRMFQIFDVKEIIDQTAAGYLYRIVDQVLTRNDGNLFFNFLNSYPQVLKKMIYHIETPSITNMILKSFESGLEQIQPQIKGELLKKVYFGAIDVIKERKNHSQNIIQGLKYFTQKMLDKGSVRKIGSNYLSECILGKQIVTALCGTAIQQDLSLQSRTHCLQIIVILLKQFKAPDNTPAKSRGSINKSSRHFGKCLAKVKLIQLIPQSIEVLITICQKIVSEIIQHDSFSNRSKKAYTLMFLQIFEMMALYTPSELKPLLSLQLIAWILQNMLNLPFCNIYHMSVKQIVMVVVSEQQLFQRLAFYQQFNFFQFLYNNFILKTKQHCFQSYLYEIINQIVNKIDGDKFEEIIKKLNKQSDWKLIYEKYEIIKNNRKRKYEDASEQEIDREQIRVRVKSIGEDMSLPNIHIHCMQHKISTAQTTIGSQTSCQSPEKNTFFVPIPNLDNNVLKNFSNPNCNLFNLSTKEDLL